MATHDDCVTIHPYFVIQDGKMEQVRSYLTRFVEMTRSEKACLYYGFTLCSNKLFCREGYKGGAGALAHLDNVGSLLGELLETGMVELKEVQVHGPEAELAKLREPLASFNPSYWVLEYGFRR